MKRMIVTTTQFAIISLLLASLAQAQEVPHTINFQSVLRNDNGDLITDNFIDMQIRILDQNGDQLYAETQPGVLVVRGAVNIMIGEGVTPGSSTPTGGVPTSVLDPATGSKSLQVQFGSNTPIGPIDIGSVPYAMYAEQALSLDPNFPESSIPGSFVTQTELNQVIQQEINDRTAGDSNLQAQITNEVNARTSADTNLQNAINNEASTRANADTNLQNQINNALTSTTTFGGDVSGTFNNLQVNNGAIGTGEITNHSVGSIDINSDPAITDSTSISGLTPFAFGTVIFPSTITSTPRSLSVQPAGSGCFKIIFSTPASSINYAVSVVRTGFFDGSIVQSAPVVKNKTTSSFDVCAGGTFPGIDFIVFNQ